MKKKLLSLLLVVVILMTSVSVGFGTMTAYAGAAGGGVEALDAFSLVDNAKDGFSSGESFSTTITIKSKNAGYKIKVNSVTASIRYYQDDTSALDTVYVDSSVIGAECGAGGSTFNVTGTISAGLAGLIRYECSYDLLDNSGNTVYSGLTGYGYSAVSADGARTGAVGTGTGKPGTKSPYTYNDFAQINSCYVQNASFKLGYETKTSWKAGGTGSESGTPYVESGTAPSTLTFGEIKWTGVGAFSSSKTNPGTWCELTTPPSGYYNFTVFVWSPNSDDLHANVEMYYRDDTAKANALAKATQYLNENREKSYYTADSWDNYLTALEKVFLAGMAVPGPNYAFKVACQTVMEMANAEKLEAAKNALSPVPADYTAAYAAYDEFSAKKNSNVTVRTYEAGTTSMGSTTIRLYTQASVDAVEAYVSTCNLELYKYDQKIVDGYTATISQMSSNIVYTDAVYTYLDIAIAEYDNTIQSNFTNTSWIAYEAAAETAKNVARDLKSNSQEAINTALNTLVSAKIRLQYVGANLAELNAQIAEGDVLYSEHDAGNLITGASGFWDAWDNFEIAYEDAVDVRILTIDKQAEVDAAAKALGTAIAALSRYRVLDVTILNNAIMLSPEYASNKYTPSSYNAWDALWLEGYIFMGLANPGYTGEDRKTYDDYDEMVRLAELITSAYNNLEKVKANFTELNEVVASIPSDDVLALYQDAYVNAIKDLVGMIDYGATFDEQETVDAIAMSIGYAIAELTPAHYKKADYSEVDELIATAEGLDRDIYTNFEIVDAAIKAVDRTKNITQQEEVDAMADAIEEALGKLEYIPADYDDVEKAIEEAEAVENKDWYANYDNITDIIANIDWEKNISQQTEVDAYATAIRQAIENLVLAEADYSGVRAAIEESEKLEPLSDFTDESVARLDLAISKVVAGYTKDKQAEVNAMEAEIRKAIADMELLPADYSRANVVVEYVKSLNRDEYRDFTAVDDAVAAINPNLNCREQSILNDQVQAVYTAIDNLKLKLADYAKLEEAITAARLACVSGEYEYTAESIQAVEDEIAKIDWELDIKHQAFVDAYIPVIEAAVAKLKYVRADYTNLDEALRVYRELNRGLYASLAELDTYVASIDMDITIDRQAEVDAIAEVLNDMMQNLEYAEADYSAVDAALNTYDSIIREYYEEEDLVPVDEAVAAVARGYKINRQAEVDKMAQDINYAIDVLRAKIKSADLTKLSNAVEAARVKVAEMSATGYEIDSESSELLDILIYSATGYQGSTIDRQKEIDALATQIEEATANLEFVFTIDLSGTSLVIEGDFIYGFEEGATSSDAEDLIKFVGPAEMKITETRNGFGTGTTIVFKSTKDGTILASYMVVVFGDANGDSVIDMFDVAYISEIANTFVDPKPEVLKAIDFAQDGFLDANDVSVMIGLANMDGTIRQDGSMEID